MSHRILAEGDEITVGRQYLVRLSQEPNDWYGCTVHAIYWGADNRRARDRITLPPEGGKWVQIVCRVDYHDSRMSIHWNCRGKRYPGWLERDALAYLPTNPLPECPEVKEP